MHGKVDDNYVRLLSPIDPKTIRQTLRLMDMFHADILQKLLAPLQDDWMIVDDKNSSHDNYPTDSGARSGTPFSFFFCLIGISTLTVVPSDGPLSIRHSPPTDRTRSVIVVSPKPLDAVGAMPLPSSVTISRIRL